MSEHFEAFSHELLVFSVFLSLVVLELVMVLYLIDEKLDAVERNELLDLKIDFITEEHGKE